MLRDNSSDPLDNSFIFFSKSGSNNSIEWIKISVSGVVTCQKTCRTVLVRGFTRITQGKNIYLKEETIDATNKNRSLVSTDLFVLLSGLVQDYEYHESRLAKNCNVANIWHGVRGDSQSNTASSWAGGCLEGSAGFARMADDLIDRGP